MIKALKQNGVPIGLGIAVIAVAILLGPGLFGDAASTLQSDVNTQTWIDIDGVSFERKLVPFDDSPALGPSGKPAFRAELCFWTRDGKVKPTPTAVLLNNHVGRPEPTFCPDCERLVTALNPAPPMELSEGQTLRAPPTEAEYQRK